MSYGRNPHYIWSDGEHLHFGMASIPECQINAFLYKILLTNRRAELAERLRIGREEWTNQMRITDSDENGSPLECEILPVAHDDPEYVAYMEWMQSQEDEVIRSLMEPPTEEEEHE